jgi:hypothetical protein
MAVWSAEDAAQAENEAQGIAGSVSESSGSNAWFTYNNAGGNKLDAYLRTSAAYILRGQCNVDTVDGLPGREAKLSFVLKNTAPKHGLPVYVKPRLDLLPGSKWVEGSSHTLLTVYAPVGSSAAGFSVNGKPEVAYQAIDRSHPIFVIDVELKPSQTKKIVVNWIEPIIDLTGKSIQTKPTLTAPVSYNPIRTRVDSSGICAVK